jgi:hypothetical protein
MTWFPPALNSLVAPIMTDFPQAALPSKDDSLQKIFSLHHYCTQKHNFGDGAGGMGHDALVMNSSSSTNSDFFGCITIC